MPRSHGVHRDRHGLGRRVNKRARGRNRLQAILKTRRHRLAFVGPHHVVKAGLEKLLAALEPMGEVREQRCEKVGHECVRTTGIPGNAGARRG